MSKDNFLLGKAVLIIEDELVFSTLVKNYVEKSGGQAFQAFSGSEALAILKQQSIDVILCDLNLPEMRGEEVVQRLHHKESQIPIIVISATTKISDIALMLRLGVKDVLVKPIRHLSILREALTKALFPEVFDSEIEELQQLEHELNLLEEFPDEAVKTLCQLKPPVRQQIAGCDIHYRQLSSSDEHHLMFDIVELSAQEFAFYTLEIGNRAAHGVMVALLLRTLFDEIVSKKVARTANQFAQFNRLLKKANQAIHSFKLDGPFPMTLGYYHRETQQLVIINAGLKVAINLNQQDKTLLKGIPLGTLRAIDFTPREFTTAQAEFLISGKYSRIQLRFAKIE